MPDKRKRDLSNYLKIPEDYLVDQCIIMDDNHTIVNAIGIKYGGISRDLPKVEIKIFDMSMDDE